MSNMIAIVAPSGYGKSTSMGKNEELKIEGLNPEETVILNVSGKPLPIKGYKTAYKVGTKLSEGGHYMDVSDADLMVKALQLINDTRPEIKNVLIDDYQYIMAFMYMSKAKETGYGKFTDIASAGFKPLNTARTLRPDLNIFVTFHQEKGDDGRDKIKTSGKLIDNAITIEGLFTVVLYGVVDKDPVSGKITYGFMTNTDGTNTAKSPAGMFDKPVIPNDLGYVLKKVNEYYN